MELALLGVAKRYGDLHALSDVSLHLQPGRVHALVGENGAGKSTALKIFAGLEQPTEGTLAIDGVPVVLSSRSAAIRSGIGLVAQQLSLIGEMSLVENLVLTRPTRLAHRRRAESVLLDVIDQLGLRIDLRTPVRNLGLAERQFGELAIGLAQGARVLLLDEPTSAIGPHESGLLFETVRKLSADGVSVLLITHRIDEVRGVAEHVTVLSRGLVTLDSEVAEITDDELVRAMVGEIPETESRRREVSGADRLVLDGVTAQGRHSVAVHDISLTVHSGEIVGVLGVAGNGQTALADTAVGIVEPARGSVTIDGQDIGGRPDLALRGGVSYVPEVRGDFLLLAAPLVRSTPLRHLDRPEYRRRGTIQWSAVLPATRALMEHHDVRPRNPLLAAGALSGGNQQKFLVGRELDGVPAAAVLHGPTQGLDLHAAARIRADIRRVADAGTAVLLVSADIDEVRELADRILVLSGGRIVDEFAVSDFDLQRVGRGMAGLLPSSSSVPPDNDRGAVS
jgi:simple sugar transport system ATP-binding protein